MMEEQGTVVAREDGTVWVKTTRRSACHGCGQGAGCGTSLLGRLFSSRPNVLALDDPLGVAVGDQVVIGIPDTLLVRASLAAYVLPLVTLVAAAGTAEWLGAADLVVALAGIAGLAAGLLLTGHLTGGADARDRYRPVLLRRLGLGVQPIPFEPVRRPGAGADQPTY
jgi:sigma-E factor negative regulatory protein RseC